MQAWRAGMILLGAYPFALGLMDARSAAAQGEAPQRVISFVVIPDAHTFTGNLRYLPAIVDGINALPVQPDFVVSLGDNVSGGKDHDVLQDAIDYERQVSRLSADHHYVIGNHECIPIEVYKLLTWEQLLGAWGMESRWYSFDVAGLHVCVLDGWISLNTAAFRDVFRRQQQWLLQDLKATDRPTVVFIHQALGFQQQDCRHWIDTDNRKFWPPANFFQNTFEAYADKIVGVFEGHKHKSLHKTLSGVTYHQMGASHAHNGQYAQVFIDLASREYFVQALPQPGEPDYEQTVQRTYGDPAVARRAQGALPDGRTAP